MMQRPWRLAVRTVFMGLFVAGSAIAQERVPAPAVQPMGPAAEWLQSTTASQHVNLDAQGRLRGELGYYTEDAKLRLIPNMPVSLTHRGKVIARVLTNAEGVFTFAPVEPGFYTLHASDPKSLLVMPILVGPRADQVAPFRVVAAGPIAPSRRSAMLAMLRPRPVNYPAAVPSFPTGQASFTRHQVVLTPQSVLTGKIQSVDRIGQTMDMTGMMIRLTRDGKMVGEARVRPDGSFAVKNVAPGPVSVFVYGPHGFASLGIQVVPPATLGQLENGDGERFVVAPQEGGSGSLNIAMSTPEDTVAASQIPGDSFTGPTPAPGAPTGFSGGGFSGGGGGGGGLGGGELIGLGALGAAAAALSDDDDGPFIPPAASIGGP